MLENQQWPWNATVILTSFKMVGSTLTELIVPNSGKSQNRTRCRLEVVPRLAPFDVFWTSFGIVGSHLTKEQQIYRNENMVMKSVFHVCHESIQNLNIGDFNQIINLTSLLISSCPVFSCLAVQTSSFLPFTLMWHVRPNSVNLFPCISLMIVSVLLPSSGALLSIHQLSSCVLLWLMS